MVLVKEKEDILMLIDTEYILSMTEANQNFSRVAKMVDQNGAAIIMKNNIMDQHQ
jgi:antitoxin Phd